MKKKQLVLLIIFVLFFIMIPFLFNLKISYWLDFSLYFNNALSPFLMIVSIVLIYLTWVHNKEEFNKIIEKEDINSLLLVITPKVDKIIDKIKNIDGFVYISSQDHFNSSSFLNVLDFEESVMRENIDKFLVYKRDILTDNIPSYSTINFPICSMRKNELMSLDSSDPSKRDECINKYIEKCKFSFFDFCEAMFDSFGEVNWINNKETAYSSSVISEFFELLGFLSDLLYLLPRGSNQKIVIQKSIYNELGRYTVYAAICILYQNYKLDAGYFKDIKKKYLYEMIELLVVQEKKELYSNRLDRFESNEEFSNIFKSVESLIIKLLSLNDEKVR